MLAIVATISIVAADSVKSCILKTLNVIVMGTAHPVAEGPAGPGHRTDEAFDAREHQRPGTLAAASIPRVNPPSEDMPMSARSKHREGR